MGPFTLKNIKLKKKNKKKSFDHGWVQINT